MLFFEVDFTIIGKEKVEELLKLNGRMSSFNSAKTGAVETEFRNFDNKVIEEMRAITLLSKGSHPFDRVKNRVSILAYYINSYPINESIQPSSIELV